MQPTKEFFDLLMSLTVRESIQWTVSPWNIHLDSRGEYTYDWCWKGTVDDHTFVIFEDPALQPECIISKFSWSTVAKRSTRKTFGSGADVDELRNWLKTNHPPDESKITQYTINELILKKYKSIAR